MSGRRHLHFSEAEYSGRWARLRSALNGFECVAAILFDPDDIYYFTGFGGATSTFQAIVIPESGEPTHLLRYAEAAIFDSSSWLEKSLTYGDRDDPLERLIDLLRQSGIDAGRIGVELASPALPVSIYQRLQTEFPQIEFVDISRSVGERRLIRSREEIEMHGRAAHVIEQALGAGIDAVHVTATEREIGAVVARSLVLAGADTPRIGVIGSGERLREVHGGLSDRALQAGDLVRLEMSNAVNRYWARIMRMVSLGKPDAETRDRYEVLRRLQEEQLEHLRPGAIPAELDALVRNHLPPDEWAMQLTGYALAFHEPAVIGGMIERFLIHAGETRPVQAGMVLHMYVTSGSLSISETVVVTEQGHRRLTTYPRDLIVV